jgi:2-keto-4-pentenoate hydratase/2-oxohepta-3-ene-1,7-dioic acid hydratase in catechol pathway
MDKLICVGKNYLKHAKELGDAVPDEPVYFIKPPSTLVEIPGGISDVHWPEQGELHHEVELVLKLGRRGPGWVYTHYTFGLDMTLRDLQNKLKKAGLPWEKAKTFQHAAVIGPWQPLESMEKVLNMEFSLRVNGKDRQKGRGSDMTWKPDFLLADLPKWFPLREGDVIFTGTPEGVGPLVNGDTLEVSGGAVNYKLHCRRGMG